MIIKKDSVGELVLRWQQFLAANGHSPGSIDGNFGSKTEAATIAWQGANGLTADGIVGERSFAKAKTQGFKYTESSVWYPPRPNFGSPSPSQVKAMFGEFQYERTSQTEIRILGDWVARNIVEVEIKQLRGVPGAPANGRIRFHKKGVDQLKEMFNEFERQGLSDLVISWAGSFYPRLIRGSEKSLSNHSWGTAFDINATENWLGKQPARVGQKGSLLKLVPIANAYGFFWGGHYQSRLDGMHFELAILDRFPTT
jgi:hypothetical protein